jgi:transposase
LARIAADRNVPERAKELFAILAEEYTELSPKLRRIEAQLLARHRQNPLSRRLVKVPAIGPISASLLAMKVPDPAAFRSGRDFAAWLGLTPKDHSTAGKQRLGVITRAGDQALRSTLVAGATSVIQQVRKGRGKPSPWLVALIKRKPPKLAAVALANKTARIAWKLMVSDENYNTQTSVAPRRQGRERAPCASAVNAARRAAPLRGNGQRPSA